MNHIEIITHLTKNAPNHTRITTPFLLTFGILFTLTGVLHTLSIERNPDGSVIYPLSINWYTAWLTSLALSFISLIVIATRKTKTSNTLLPITSISFILRSIAPSLIAYIAIFIGCTLPLDSHAVSFYTSLFIIFYALALFSLKLFLPLSTRILATLMLSFGITTWIISWKVFGDDDNRIDGTLLANFYLMFAGLLHIFTAVGALLFERPIKHS